MVKKAKTTVYCCVLFLDSFLSKRAVFSICRSNFSQGPYSNNIHTLVQKTFHIFLPKSFKFRVIQRVSEDYKKGQLIFKTQFFSAHFWQALFIKVPLWISPYLHQKSQKKTKMRKMSSFARFFFLSLFYTPSLNQLRRLKEENAAKMDKEKQDRNCLLQDRELSIEFNYRLYHINEYKSLHDTWFSTAQGSLNTDLFKR